LDDKSLTEKALFKTTDVNLHPVAHTALWLSSDIAFFAASIDAIDAGRPWHSVASA
jgi:hypothetical protein